MLPLSPKRCADMDEGGISREDGGKSKAIGRNRLASAGVT